MKGPRIQIRPVPGFSLLEVMVAAGISSIILLVLLSSLNTGVGLWSRSTSQIEARGDIRFALQRMGEEFSSALLPPEEADFVENHPNHLHAAAAGGAHGGYLAESLFMVGPTLHSGTGDLCVIAYRLNPQNLAIERAVIDSEDAWAGTPRFDVASYPAASFDWRPLIEGAVEFEVQCHDRPVPPAASQVIDDWDADTHGAPSRITLRVRSVSTKTRELVLELGVGDPAATRLIDREARELRREISLR